MESQGDGNQRYEVSKLRMICSRTLVVGWLVIECDEMMCWCIILDVGENNGWIDWGSMIVGYDGRENLETME